MYRNSMSAKVLAFLLLASGLVTPAAASEPSPEFSYSLHYGNLEIVRESQTITTYPRGEPITDFDPEYRWRHEYFQFGATSRFDNYLDVDFRIGVGTSDSDTSLETGMEPVTLKRDLDIIFGVYAKMYNHDWRRWRPYLLAGFSHQAASIDQANGFSTGAGLQVAVDRDYWVSVEYMSFFEGDRSSQGVTVALHYHYD